MLLALFVLLTIFGLLATLWGVRGRRGERLLACAGCGFDLRGHSHAAVELVGEQCPECGRAVRDPDEVVRFVRVRRPMVTRAGLAVVAVSLTLAIGLGVRTGGSFDAMQLYPQGYLIRLLDSGNPKAFAEASRRIAADELDQPAYDTIVVRMEDALDRGTSRRPIERQWFELFNEAYQWGHIDKEHLDRVAERLFTLQLTTREEHSPGGPVPFAVEMIYHGPTDSGGRRGFSAVEPSEFRAEILDASIGGVPVSFEPTPNSNASLGDAASTPRRGHTWVWEGSEMLPGAPVESGNHDISATVRVFWDNTSDPGPGSFAMLDDLLYAPGGAPGVAQRVAGTLGVNPAHVSETLEVGVDLQALLEGSVVAKLTRDCSCSGIPGIEFEFTGWPEGTPPLILDMTLVLGEGEVLLHPVKLGDSRPSISDFYLTDEQFETVKESGAVIRWMTRPDLAATYLDPPESIGVGPEAVLVVHAAD
ncbi:MAG: hypothetical protein ACI89L_002648 [Phycisphaerales bacterium]|jgi:hypothetical protein